MRTERTTWRGRNLVRVDSERLYTLDVGRLVPKLRIPSFQRGYVWSAEDAVRLLESIILGYPIGGLVLWDPEGGGWGLSSNRLIVLDGQQRLTTLAGALLPGGMGANVHRVVYDVAADAFLVADELSPDQIRISDMGDIHKVSQFWMNQADLNPNTWRPSTSPEEAAARQERLWGEIAPGVPFPRTRAARKTHGVLLNRLTTAVRADEDARSAAWEAAHPGRAEWCHRLDFLDRRLRDHQTSVTVVRGGTLEDVKEVFRRLNTMGRPLDEEGVKKLLELSAEGDS